MMPKNIFSRQQWRKRHREQTYGHRERGGEDEIYGESYMETYIVICKIDSQWEFGTLLTEPHGSAFCPRYLPPKAIQSPHVRQPAAQ